MNEAMCSHGYQSGKVTALQIRRRLLQVSFFVLFILAPPLDVFRVDVTQAQVILFGHVWALGIDAVMTGESSGVEGGLNLILRGLLPLAAFLITFGWVAWRYGRLYCGWLCPHFSVVEMINGLMRRASARPNLWEKSPLPLQHADGRPLPQHRYYWWLVTLAVGGFAFLWALILLTYLLPPSEVYSNLVSGSLTRNQTIFLIAATTVFCIEFLMARHLFCRFGCAVGVFQSLIWMANRRAMVVGFDRGRAAECRDCDSFCEVACPMRLKPRTSKRYMFTCTECGQCIAACEQVQKGKTEGVPPILQWVSGACALDVSAREFGKRPQIPADCYCRRGQ